MWERGREYGREEIGYNEFRKQSTWWGRGAKRWKESCRDRYRGRMSACLHAAGSYLVEKGNHDRGEREQLMESCS